MALRAHEKRILAEVEQRLREDDPELAERLKTFGADEKAASADETSKGRWKPWLVCGLIVVAVISLLVLLFLIAPGMSDVPARPDHAPEARIPGVGSGMG